MNPDSQECHTLNFAELCARSHYSFLQSASSPEELVTAAHEAGYSGLALADEASLAGIVKAHAAAKALNFPLMIGSQFHLTNALHVVVIAANLQGYKQLSSLISAARRAAPKGDYRLSLEQLLQSGGSNHVILIANPLLPAQPSHLSQLKNTFSDRFWIGLSLQYGHHDQEIYDYARELCLHYDLPWVAAGNVQMHHQSRLNLLRAMTAIRLKTTIDELGYACPQNSEMAIRPLAELQETYPSTALLNTQKLQYTCQFSLDELRYLYPKEVVPPEHTPSSFLRQEVLKGAKARWPQGVLPRITALIEKELVLIEELKFEYYFLTVYDIVLFARSQHILCQGRGSAANSVVCFCLGITEVDPAKIPILFERFISRERNEPPDIDVDFEHHRREEVIQYIYTKYGRHRAALLATIVTYRPKSAIRDIGKALGFDELIIRTLTKEYAWWEKKEHLHQRLEESHLNHHAPRVQAWLELVGMLIRQPRHLSQHVGGFFIAQHNAEQMVPIENAAMKNRTIIQWDKDDVETLGLLKVDVLALGMLSALHKAFDYVELYREQRWTLATLPQEDPKVYEMLCRGDSLGVFQVESRAQMAMLPRLKPATFYDLVVQVALVRPGPIQGKMVHPYLQRRDRLRQGTHQHRFPSVEIEAALGRTLGVPLFQEQVIQLAIVAAGFTPGEADGLRRSMASWRKAKELEDHQVQLRKGMAKRGYSSEFAERIIEQIKGFGSYGFPESHAASFALLVYASAWLKCHEPAAFYTALLNGQPMGFYSPSQIVQDAVRHGIDIKPIDVLYSSWDHKLESLPIAPQTQPAIRLGLRLIKGLKKMTADKLHRALQDHQPKSYEQLVEQAQLNEDERLALTSANSFRHFFSRHQAHWQSAYFYQSTTLIPQSALLESTTKLSEPDAKDHCRADFQATGLTLGPHPLTFLRGHRKLQGCKTHAQLARVHHRGFARVAGLITSRQRPGTASGVMFVTLEDETGSTNVIVWPSLAQRRREIIHAKAVIIKGSLERKDQVMHLVAGDIIDISNLLEGIQSQSRDFH